MAGLSRRIAAIALAVILAATIAACGGGSSNVDPQQVLHETFSNPKSISSGKLDVSLGFDAQGSQSGSFDASISGPFQSGGHGALPQFDLTGKLSGSAPGIPAISFEGGLAFTSDNAYLSFQGNAYRLPHQWFARLQSLVSRAARASGGQAGVAGVFGSLGINPRNWFTNLSDEGTADVAGTETDHIAGDVDLGKVAADLRKLNRLSQQIPGQTQKLTPRQLALLQRTVRNAHVDIYSGSDDHILRKLAISLDLAPPSGSSAVTSVGIDFAVTLSDLNQPQTISAPQNAKPLPASFLRQLQSIGPLGSALGGGGGSSGSTLGGGAAALQQSYERCVKRAGGGAGAINHCLQQLYG